MTIDSLQRVRGTKHRARRLSVGLILASVLATLAGPAPPRVLAASTQRLLSCGSVIVFAESALHNPPMLLDDSSDPLDRAVTAELRTRSSDNLTVFGAILTTPVRVLSTTNGIRHYLMGDLNDRGTIWSADIANGRLRGYAGGCDLRTTVDGRRALLIWLQPDAPKPTTSTRTLRLLVGDEECGGGRNTLTGRVLTSIKVLPTRVEITIALRPLPLITSPDPTVSIARTCEGYPPSPITVRLPVKLGRRTLINAGTYPSTVLRPHQPTKEPPTPTGRVN